MSHRPIVIENISLYVQQKTCFEHFNAQITTGKRIVIMGRNGQGKSTLLKIVQGLIEPSTGRVVIPKDVTFGYVPQTVTDYPELSGGQRFNKALSAALAIDPDVLCLDEPTNHLDLNNKRSLLRMLRSYQGTLLIISHDPELLALDFDEIWHIQHGSIEVFTGNYHEYLKEHERKQHAVAQQKEQSQKELRELRKAAQQEQKRAAQSKAAHKGETDRVLLGAMKERGSQSAGKSAKRLASAEQKVHEKLESTFVHKVIRPKFNLDARAFTTGKAIISIIDGSCGYTKPILSGINLQVQPTERVAIMGDNGSGKSTFFKALLQDPRVTKDGQWIFPSKKDIGYLDQHYSTLNPDETVFETIQAAAPQWNDHEVRKHLNDFLFRTQEEVTTKVIHLSGGEKARLCLAQIAAQSPSLLLLDEITNNVDLDTRQHIIEVLQEYPGTMIIISHDPHFLKELGISHYYKAKNGRIFLRPMTSA